MTLGAYEAPSPFQFEALLQGALVRELSQIVAELLLRLLQLLSVYTLQFVPAPLEHSVEAVPGCIVGITKDAFYIAMEAGIASFSGKDIEIVRQVLFSSQHIIEDITVIHLWAFHIGQIPGLGILNNVFVVWHNLTSCVTVIMADWAWLLPGLGA